MPIVRCAAASLPGLLMPSPTQARASRWTLHALECRLWRGAAGGIAIAIAIAALLTTAPTECRAAPVLNVQIRDAQVFMEVEDRTLADALAALAQAGDFELKINDEFKDPVTLRVRGQSLTTAIRRLVRQHSSVLVYGKGPDGKRRLSQLRVYRANQGQPPARVQRAGNAAGGQQLEDAAARANPGRLAELAAILNNNSSTRDQRQAITQLRSIGGDGAVNALSSALRLPDKSVRSYAVAVLGQIGSPQAVDLLGTAALSDEEADVRIRAVIALARQHGDQAREFVEAVASRDTDERVQEAARARLGAW